ncbi:MAG TPA: hypothetical protein VMV44_16545 [Rectinemataceae bacterium]|nr:hypothetical protein [Rectinemataceae bacterium]
MTIADFLALDWSDDGQALIEAPLPSPILADPSFLFPAETPDGSWALFAHTAFGIRRYSSADGLVWRDRGMVLRNAMRAFVRRVDGEYLLCFERYRPLAIPLQLLPRRPRWRSRLEYARSLDLRSWSRPEPLLEADFEWAKDEGLGESVSNPCLVPTKDGWRLWFSASLVTIPDCGFDEPRFIGCAEAAVPRGPFRAEALPRIGPGEGRAAPRAGLVGTVSSPDPHDGAELGAGSIKVFELADGWLGLQNRIYRDEEGRSRSALFILRSDDGLAFRSAREAPLLAPSTGWRSSHVYACDCRRDPADGAWYLYYNARDGWYKTEGRERIGRIVAKAS